MNKQNIKNNKGITLVALIITIVVLLILAVVAIGAVKNSNIIGYAQNAAEGYEQGKAKEEGEIKEVEDLLEKYTTGGKTEDWELQSDGETVVLDTANEEVKLDYTYYYYTNAFADTKFADSLGSGYYWLASPCVHCVTRNASFDVRGVGSGSISDGDLFCSDGDAYSNRYGVRAVVYI